MLYCWAILPHKDKILLDMRANVIYKITCSCGEMYIGETRRNIYTRMAEHAKTSGTNITAVGQHLADNPGTQRQHRQSRCFGKLQI